MCFIDFSKESHILLFFFFIYKRHETNKIMLYERLITRGTSVLKNFVTTLLHQKLERNLYSLYRISQMPDSFTGLLLLLSYIEILF